MFFLYESVSVRVSVTESESVLENRNCLVLTVSLSDKQRQQRHQRKHPTHRCHKSLSVGKNRQGLQFNLILFDFPYMFLAKVTVCFTGGYLKHFLMAELTNFLWREVKIPTHNACRWRQALNTPGKIPLHSTLRSYVGVCVCGCVCGCVLLCL